jgi:tRNA(fMet)-specific endonuclease VapC
VRYLLDTNTVIALLKGHKPVLSRIRQTVPSDVALSAIVAHELYFGAYRSRDTAKNFALVEDLEFEVLPFDKDDAAQSGQVRAVLAAAGTPVGPYDVLIAGQALTRGLILVTRNTREFRRIPDLLMENWEG